MPPGPPLMVALGIVGPGLVGRTLMAQIAAQAPSLLEELRLQLQVVAVANSRKMLLNVQQPLQEGPWERQLEDQGRPADLATLGQHVASVASSSTHGCGLIVDCSAGEAVPDHYAAWVEAGLNLVTPNKKLGAGPLSRYKRLQELQRSHGSHFLYEATVGAGLPVLSTLRCLLDTGDAVQRVEGVPSGTLSFLFNGYAPGRSWAAAVADARAQGYTEPDPREDLSGMDVARKVVILARECGLAASLEALQVTSLVPPELQGGDVSVEEFMARLPEFDAGMASQAMEAEAAGQVLRYVGVVDVAAGSSSVSLRRYPKDHPFAQLQGSDNMISFTTRRYSATPLIVRGPGAGAEVTAAGVFGDVIEVARRCQGRGRASAAQAQ